MSDAVKGHLVFACGESLYAVPAELAAEVVSLPALTRVPGAAAYLMGVFAHRGEVIPVVDLALLTGAKVDASTFRRAVLLRLARGSLALTATRVAGVQQVGGAAQALGTSGVKAHLRGPLQTPVGEVAVLEPEGLFELLSQV
jgi:purine-binding chemotaxis protein CheW